MKIEHKGLPGHFCGAADCCFSLHSVIKYDDESYVISTVGCYHPGVSPYEREDDNRETIGLGRLYETMVFYGDRDGNITDFNEIYLKGYNTPEEAEEGHDAALGRFINIVRLYADNAERRDSE